MARLMPTEIVYTDVASAGHGAGAEEGGGPQPDVRRAKIRLKENAASDRRYIESCFGPSLCSGEWDELWKGAWQLLRSRHWKRLRLD